MYCQHCGKQIPDDAKFCKYCGGAVYESQVDKPEKNPLEMPELLKNNWTMSFIIYFIFMLMLLICGDDDEADSAPIAFIIAGLIYPLIATWGYPYLRIWVEKKNRQIKFVNYGLIVSICVNCLLAFLGALDGGCYDNYTGGLIIAPLMIISLSIIVSYFKK